MAANAPTPPAVAPSIRMRMAAGASTLIVGSFGMRLIGLLNIAILARILAPEDYGIIALAMVVTGFVQIASELQVSAAIIRIQEIKDSHYDTAFTINLLRAGVMALAIFGSAGVVSEWMETPELAPVLRWLSLSALLSGLASPRLVAFAREVDFTRETMVTLAGKLTALVVAILVSIMVPNYWALVAGVLASSLVGVALSHAAAPYRPRLSIAHAGEFIAFGGWLTAMGIASFASAKVATLVIGARLDIRTVGFYNMGDQIATMATNELATPFTRVIYSGLSMVAADKARLTSAYIRAQTTVLGLLLPAGVGAALVANELVLVLMGPGWETSAAVIQIIAPVIGLTTIVSGVQALCMVKGDTKAIFLCHMFNLIIRIMILTLAISYFGFFGILWARIITGIFFSISMLYLIKLTLDLPMWEPVFKAWRSFVACAVMAAIVLTFDWTQDTNPDFMIAATVLIGKTAIGGLVYCLSHLALWRLCGRPDGFETAMLQTCRGAVQRVLRAVQIALRKARNPDRA